MENVGIAFAFQRKSLSMRIKVESQTQLTNEWNHKSLSTQGALLARRMSGNSPRVARQTSFTIYPHPRASCTVSPMQFTDADLREYIEIWSSEFHEMISLEEARLSATALM